MRPVRDASLPRWFWLALGILAGVLLCELSEAEPRRADGRAAEALPASVATACRRYRHGVRRASRREMGRDAEPAILLAQLAAESRCAARARSPAGAVGLAQFTRAGAAHVAELRPELGAARRMSPRWAIRAQASYMAFLVRWARRSLGVEDACGAWRWAAYAYNAGMGWALRERDRADSAEPDAALDSCARRAAACAETRAYLRRIGAWSRAAGRFGGAALRLACA